MKDDPIAFLREVFGYTECRRLPDGTIIGLLPMAFTCGLFVGLNKHSYDRRYCYETYALALDAIKQWDGQGDPPGPWIKCKGEPGGDRLGPGAVET